MEDESDTAVAATAVKPLIVKLYPWETRHEWIARVSFVKDHVQSYGFERALSLSMVWANMKFLGCRYPEKTENLVVHYEKPDFDEGIDPLPKNGCYIINGQDFPDGVPAEGLEPSAVLEATGEKENVEVPARDEDGDSDTATQVSLLISDIRGKIETEKNQTKPPNLSISQELADVYNKLELSGEENHSVSLLTSSCQRANFDLSFAFKEHVDNSGKKIKISGFQATVLIGDVIAGKGDSYSTKKDAKKHACDVVIGSIQDYQQKTGSKPGPNQSQNVDKIEVLQCGPAATMSSEGIGGQLLRKMGWNEEGANTTAAATQQPFDSYGNYGRSGLGFGAPQPPQLRQNLEQKLHEFVNSANDELVFSSEFTPDERKLIHTICAQYGLHHKSHGKGDDRKLVIQKRSKPAPNSNAQREDYSQQYSFHQYPNQQPPSASQQPPSASQQPQAQPAALSYWQPPPQSSGWQGTAQGNGSMQVNSNFFQHAANKAASRPNYHPYQGKK